MKSLFNSVLETASLFKNCDGQNLPELTENDIIDSIKVLVTLAKTMNLIWEGDSTNGNA